MWQNEKQTVNDKEKAEPVFKSDRERFKRIWNSKRWALIRNRRLWEDPICQICKSKGLTEAATTVDHVIPLAVDISKAYDYDNTQSLCWSCHGHKSNVEDRVLRTTGKSISETMNELESFDNDNTDQ